MKYPLRVVSVERSLFEGDVEFMVANGAEGELGVLARHAPLMTILKPGGLRIQEALDLIRKRMAEEERNSRPPAKRAARVKA